MAALVAALVDVGSRRRRNRASALSSGGAQSTQQTACVLAIRPRGGEASERQYVGAHVRQHGGEAQLLLVAKELTEELR